MLSRSASLVTRSAVAVRSGGSGVRTSTYCTASLSSSSATSSSSLLAVKKIGGTSKNVVKNIKNSECRTQRRFMGGDMPVPQSNDAPLWHGHTVAKEGWEETIYFYYIAGIILQAAVLMGSPETSIESWARPEAQARLVLKSQGKTDFEFGTHYQDLMAKQNLDLWSQFAAKAVTPGEDDDDEEDEDDDEELHDDVDDEVRTAGHLDCLFGSLFHCRHY
jgi:hypothetical protein